MQSNLEQLILRLSKDHNLLNSVEEATKQGAVLPILSALGWDCFNIEEVSPEFSVGNGRVDYCLRLNNNNSVFIEVKRGTEDLEKHEKQLLEYAFGFGVNIAILTNGLTWWFYLPLVGGTWQQRKFFSVDIKQQSTEAAAKHFQDFISRESIVDGSAVEKAIQVKKGKEKNKSIKEALPKAWEQLLEEPDSFLLEILADKVEGICGHNPETEILTTFIHQINVSKPLPLCSSNYSISTPRKKEIVNDSPKPSGTPTTSLTVSDSQFKLSMPRKNVEAVGNFDVNGFLVQAGSKFSREDSQSISKGNKDLKNKLISEGVLASKELYLELVKDFHFRSPAEAAGVIVGFSINAKDAWKDRTGKSLNQLGL
jgi:hypothetical protein